MEPEYEKAANELKRNDPPVSLVKVDADAEKALAGRFGVTGFPTLKVSQSTSSLMPFKLIPLHSFTDLP